MKILIERLGVRAACEAQGAVIRRSAQPFPPVAIGHSGRIVVSLLIIQAARIWCPAANAARSDHLDFVVETMAPAARADVSVLAAETIVSSPGLPGR
jgi:hypothetical protein